MKEEIYKNILNLSSFNDIIGKFHDTLIDTNRGHKFFVDWDKIRDNVEKYKVELNILNSLIGSKNFNAELKGLLNKYPEVLPVVPLLLAIRGKELLVIKDFLDANSGIVEYNFAERKLTNKEMEQFIEFFEKTGLEYFFKSLSNKSIYDYATGVEVGMDTNARKNRSGKAMELLLEPIIIEINKRQGKSFKILSQKNFKYLEDNFGIEVSTSIKHRKADFILVSKDNKVINIETNFFSGTGSKPQEIVDSYINRQEELAENGFRFIWVTDGYGWKGQKNQIAKGFEKIDFLLNLHFVRVGLLERILIN